MKTPVLLIISTMAVLFLAFLIIRNNGTAYTNTEKLFNKELKKNNVHNALLSVYSPGNNIDWNFAGGQFRNGEAVTSANPFLTASIGKTFTATAIAVLKEQGKLSFEDKISKYLPGEIIENLHVFEGNDYSKEISIAQLLQHTSGLPDYFEGKTFDGSPNAMELIFSDTSKFWSPEETIQFTKDKMNPIFPPGTAYQYSDTEYNLLGLIVENVSKLSLQDFFKTYFFEAFEMNNTSMYLRSNPIKNTRRTAELFAEDFECSTMTSLSADWAGGGLLSTSQDLIRFHEALNSGRIISDTTLRLMQNWTRETKGMYYGFGLRKIVLKELFPMLPDVYIVGHSGSTGSFMFYCPQLDVYLAGTLNQTDEVKNSVVLMVKILSFIKKEHKR